MWPAHLKPVVSTSAWRFTLVFSGLFLAIFSAAVLVLYSFTIGSQKTALELNLAQVSQELGARANSLERAMFVQLIQRRTDNSDALIVALSDREELLYGNLSRVPDTLPGFPEHRYFPIVVRDVTGAPAVRTAIGSQLQTPHGTLTIAIFDDNQQLLERSFWLASGVVLAGALVLTLCAGFAFSRYVLRRLQQIARLTAEVKAGRLERRLPVGRRQDEFDQIAGQINAMLDEIDELLQSVSGVTDSIAHDLRTPLARVRLSMEKSLGEPGLSARERQWREQHIAELDQLVDTFNAMLELTQLERGVHSPLHDRCDLDEIINDAVDLIMPLADAKGQQLRLSTRTPAQLNGNRTLLFRACYNLLDNAVKYTPEGGTITVLLVDRQLVIEDSGPGIPEAEQDKVFQRLYRLDQSRTGTSFGLGLSIVRAVVALHGGRIQLSNAHPGLRITLDL